jgi:cation diffusion facilitator CzcD-associated flavoprotein CzcO
MSGTAGPAQDGPLECELCIVGAGYAALNGLNAAAKYLKRGARVVLIDKNQTWGGQWVSQYDFVRLHQPYQMFTAGDQPWKLKRDAGYLATRREVLDHLSSIPEISGRHLQIQPLFGNTYCSRSVRDGRVEVEAESLPNGKPTRRVRIRARRLLWATGAEIEMLPPFPISSPQVRSVAVSDPVLMTPEFLESEAPVYIIGAGKTAMDTARHVIQGSHGRARSVNLLVGGGMYFFHRDNIYPRGLQRYRRGKLVGDVFLEISQHFDGQNEVDVMASLERQGILFSVFGSAANCRYGMLSSSERHEVRTGVDQVYRGHLVDVDGTRMVLREGQAERSVSVAPGSWFINCTTHLPYHPHQAVLQDGGLVCAPQYPLGFTGVSAYMLTHLWYRDALSDIAPQLFRLRIDVEPKLRFAPHLAVMAMANMALVGARLPLSVPLGFLGDFNKWFPLHRQLMMTARVVAGRGAALRKAERVLKVRYSDPSEPV